MNSQLGLSFGLILILIFLSIGCNAGGGQRGNAQRFVKESGFASDPLMYTAVSRTLLTQQNYFVSYSQTSGRLGIIDADRFTEIWGTYIAPYVPYVFNLPGYEGAGFVGEDGFTVVVREGVRRFAAPGVSTWNRAQSVIAVAGYDATTRTAHVVRFRGDNIWEEASLQVFSPDDAVNKVRVVVSDRGRFVLLISSSSGSFSVLEDKGGAYVLRRKCVFSEGKPLSGAVIDEDAEKSYVTADKQILEIDLGSDAGCDVPATWPEVLLGQSSFADIGSVGAGRIYATEKDRIHLLQRSGSSMIPAPSFPACAEPTAVKPFAGDGLAVTCVNRATSTDPAVTEGSIRNININIYSASGEALHSSEVAFDHKSGVVFYPEKSEFFQVFDSAAGEITVTDVTTGSSRKIGGIYLEGVLDRL